MKKRTVSAIAVLFFSAILVFSCAKRPSSEETRLLYGKAENDIRTYTKTDPKKTQLVIAVVEGDNVGEVVRSFGDKYPDIQPIIVYLQKGTDEYSAAKQWIMNGYLPDIVYNLDFGTDDGKYLENLSGYGAVAQYETESLQKNDRDGSIYRLPGAARIMGIAYNKTLFRRYGWTEPKTFDEFIILCDRIRKDTGGTVEPYNPNGKYALDFTAGLEGFAYGQVFAGIENHSWLGGVLNGEESFSGHMEPFFQIAEKLKEHGILNGESFDYSYTTRSKNFSAGKIAMINVFTDEIKNSKDFEFDFMPFPSSGGGKSYVSTRQAYNVSVVKRNRTEKEKQAVKNYIDYISTPGAQTICMGGGLMYSSVKNTPVNDSPFRDSLKDVLKNGLVFERIDFRGGKIPVTFSSPDIIRTVIQEMTDKALTPEQACRKMDEELRDKAVHQEPSFSQEIIGTSEKDFTVLETSEYIADAFRRKTGADIALIPDNNIYRGNINRIFKGGITKAMLTVIVPRSLDNYSRLQLAGMTGQNLLEAMNHPPEGSSQPGSCIYAFSGLSAVIAPWNEPGKRYLSVTLPDGKKIDPEKNYTVAYWQGMVDEQYVSQVFGTFEGKFADILEEAVTADQKLKPDEKKRVRLVWEEK